MSFIDDMFISYDHQNI